MTRRTLRVSVALALLSVAALAGCRPEEQERPLSLKPGEYLGPSDRKLDDGQIDQLQNRIRGQRFS